MLVDPTARPDTANPAVSPALSGEDAAGARTTPTLPAALTALARRARTDHTADLALVTMLFDRHWSVDDIDAVTGLSRDRIEGLAGVRRPRTASSDVADRAVARHLAVPESSVPRSAEPRSVVPEPRRG